MYKSVKCKKCRKELLNEAESVFIDAHNAALRINSEENCPSIQDGTLIFLNEETLSDWIKSLIVSENWSKGKLHCSNCNMRVGAFDFVSGIKCLCDRNVLPAVHLIKSKIDLIK